VISLWYHTVKSFRVALPAACFQLPAWFKVQGAGCKVPPDLKVGRNEGEREARTKLAAGSGKREAGSWQRGAGSWKLGAEAPAP